MRARRRVYRVRDDLKQPLRTGIVRVESWPFPANDAGDLLLRTTAVSLSAQLRDADFLARLGGDEFVALVSHLPAGREQATRVATEIVGRLLTAAGQDLVEGGKRISVSASVGLALFPHDARGGGSLLRLADTSMYRAKQTGRNRFQLAG
jgi:diguanylate cyclase (GGDEF)-like protein